MHPGCGGLCGEECLKTCQECIAGAEPTTPKIQLPCGHSFHAEWLDKLVRLGDTYVIDSNGIVTGFRQPVQRITSIPGCPTCGEPLSGVRRYASLYKVRDLHGEIDRTYAKFGRVLGSFQDVLSLHERSLQVRFATFCSGISLSPLARSRNQYLIQQRGCELDELQTVVCKFRDEFVVPFEDGIKIITSLLANPADYPVPVLSFALRFKLLYFRCRLTTLNEGLSTARFLRQQDDPTKTLQGIGLGLFMLMRKHFREYAEDINKYISGCRERQLKSLEVEFRLVQSCFVGCANQVERGLLRHRINNKASFDRIEELIRAYPNTAGRFKDVVSSIHSFADGGSLRSPLHELLGGKDIHQELGKHKIGHLIHCQNCHPYSTETFKHCPECGPKAPPPIDYNAMLASDSAAWVADFKRVMSLKK